MAKKAACGHLPSLPRNSLAQAEKHLLLHPGVEIGVTMPAAAGNPVTRGAQCRAYNPASGKWNNPSTFTSSGPEYFMPCITIYQNIDAFVATGTVTGSVDCLDGKPAAYKTVTMSNRFNKYITITNSNGKYKIKAEATSAYPYTIATSDGSSQTMAKVNANTANQASKITMTDCENGTSGGTTMGSFTAPGNSYSGYCISVPDVGTGGALGNIDVAITTLNGSS